MSDHQSSASEDSEVSKLKADRLKKLEGLKEQGINPYPYRFE